MKAENIAILEQHKFYWERLNGPSKNANIPYDVLQDIQKVHNEEISVHFYNLWCGECKIEMFTNVYNTYFQYLKKSKPHSAPLPMNDQPITPVPSETKKSRKKH